MSLYDRLWSVLDLLSAKHALSPSLLASLQEEGGRLRLEVERVAGMRGSAAVAPHEAVKTWLSWFENRITLVNLSELSASAGGWKSSRTWLSPSSCR
jgi:hypothetical protein